MNAKGVKIPIPKSSRKKALLLVDIQHGFIKNAKKSFLLNLKKLFVQQMYDLYIEITFHADAGSIWDKQTEWTFPYEPSVPEIMELLQHVDNKKVLHIVKETSSAFKGDKNLYKILTQKGIEEVHIVGFDLSDCVFSTAHEAFDLGFYTYVIEECTGVSKDSGGEKIYKYAIAILRNLGLTNRSK